MIPVDEIRRQARNWDLPEETIERDYVLRWVLWGIANYPDLFNTWVFRGGTCLKKCYASSHRYSEDLDFTVLPGGPADVETLQLIFSDILPRVANASGIDFDVRTPRFEERPHGQSIQGRIYFRGPRNAPNPTAIKLDIVPSEQVVQPPVLREIGHPYSDELPVPNRVRCYNFDELFAEKIRALGERCRPRDLYDVVYLFRRIDLNRETDQIQLVLEKKCEAKGIMVPTYDRVSALTCRADIEARWGNMLGHQLGVLPLFEAHWEELPNFFSWLNGDEYEEGLPAIDVKEGEVWEPLASEWQRGEDDLFQPIRFAAVNRLCLSLGYQNRVRDVEPYSLRLPGTGNLLLYALRADGGGIRAYRVDRIQSVKVINRPFRPVFRVEFTEKGRLSAPATRRRRTTSTSAKYVIECTYCGKQFRRARYSLRLRPHKQKGSLSECPGRTAYFIGR